MLLKQVLILLLNLFVQSGQTSFLGSIVNIYKTCLFRMDKQVWEEVLKLKIDCEYQFRDDLEFILEAEMINLLELAKQTKISRTTLNEIKKGKIPGDKVCEKFYSFVYENKYRINSIKEELLKEKYDDVLFHGSKMGLEGVSVDGSRSNCDFGKGFYLGETYEQALAFVAEYNKSSVYSFHANITGLIVKEFECSLDWMLVICYYRGMLGEYSSKEYVVNLVKEVEGADVIVAPIADNKMFYIMSQFVEGLINAEMALHSMSASKLGKQFIFKTKKAIERLKPIEKYYICDLERENCKKRLVEKGFEIDTKLKLAKRQFREGLYIEEILK